MLKFILGKKSKDKIEQVRAFLREKKASAFVVTALDEIACKFHFG